MFCGKSRNGGPSDAMPGTIYPWSWSAWSATADLFAGVKDGTGQKKGKVQSRVTFLPRIQ
jgi:hypothetical protein